MLEGPTSYRTQPESASRRWAAETRERVAAMTLSDYLETIWIPRRRYELEPTSFMSAKGNVDRYIAPYFRDTLIRDLTTDVIQGFYQHVLSTPRPMGRLLSKQTVIRMHAVLHRALQELVIAEVLGRNPCDGARPRERKSDRPEIRIWTPEQLHAFLDWARNDRLFPLWRTLGFTGLRRGEALGLQWRDLRFQDRLLAVRRALITAGTSTYLTAPKSSQSRVIDLDEETVEVLKAHREESRNLQPESNPDDFVFTDRNGAPVVPNFVTRQFRGLVCASPVPRIRLHDPRHTHASHLLESGASISSVQERLGHSDVVVTLNLYSHVLPGSQRLAVDRLQSFYDNWGSGVDPREGLQGNWLHKSNAKAGPTVRKLARQAHKKYWAMVNTYDAYGYNTKVHRMAKRQLNRAANALTRLIVALG